MNAKVTDWIENLAPAYGAIYAQIRELILDAHPMVTEKFTYGVPFYYLHGMLFYFSRQKKGTRYIVGFCNGFMLQDPFGMLKAEEKQTLIKQYYLNPKNVDFEQLKTYIYLAIEYKLNKKKLPQ
jgi:hypothetical protein